MGRERFSWVLDIFVGSPRRRFVAQSSIFLILIFPFLVLAFVGIIEIRTHIDRLIYSRREAVVRLAALLFKERIDHLANVGVSLASRVRFREFVSQGKWSDAMLIIKDGLKYFPEIDRAFLADISGTEQADFPSLSGGVGNNFSHRDWYRGVMKTQNPYVSELYTRAATPRINVIAIAVPIKEDEQTIGILVLQIHTDILLRWTQDIDIGPGGFFYFVDKNGMLVAHPAYATSKELVNFSDVPSVQKVLSGKRGIEIAYNPVDQEERLVAYEPIEPHGFGVLGVQPTRLAFSERKQDVSHVATLIMFALITHSILFATLLGVIRKIVEYREKERVFLESIGDGAFAIDRSWNITLWNKAAARITGWSRSEVLGLPFRQFVKFVRAEDKTENITFIEEAMLFKERRTMAANTLLIAKDGQEIPVADSCAPVMDSAGNVTGAIVVFRDATTEKQLDKIKEDFVFQIVHDLRAPSTAIKLAIEAFESDGLSKNKKLLRENISLIKSANVRMLKLINDLLETARSGIMHVAQKDRVDFSKILSAVVNELHGIAEKKKITIELKFPEALPKVDADADQVREIFVNLIDNALKYNKIGGTVVVTAAVEDGKVSVRIKDTGIGISTDDIPKLFDPYFRSAGNVETQGTGLGLYIVKNLVESFSGTISVSSRPEEGTIFTVTFPAAR